MDIVWFALFILLIVLMIGALPHWPHSRSWGYYPSAIVGAVLALMVALIALGFIVV